MRALTIIFCLFISANALAQSKGNDPLYIVDGKTVSSIKGISPHDTYETAVLSDSVAKTIYGLKAANGAMIVTTMHGAEHLYQQKLIPFSNKYKKYLDKKQGDDSNLSYVINNTMLLNMTKKTVRELSDLKPSNIKKVDFKTTHRFKTDGTVVITTNDDQ